MFRFKHVSQSMCCFARFWWWKFWCRLWCWSCGCCCWLGGQFWCLNCGLLVFIVAFSSSSWIFRDAICSAILAATIAIKSSNPQVDLSLLSEGAGDRLKQIRVNWRIYLTIWWFYTLHTRTIGWIFWIWRFTHKNDVSIFIILDIVVVVPSFSKVPWCCRYVSFSF